MKHLLLLLCVLFLFSCAAAPTKVRIDSLPTSPMPFEIGIKLLADNIADQLRNIEIEKMPQHRELWQSQNSGDTILKNVVLDPFIDTNTGYPVKANARIANIFTQEWQRRMNLDGTLAPEKLQSSDYILNGMISQEGEQSQSSIYLVLSTVILLQSCGVGDKPLPCRGIRSSE